MFRRFVQHLLADITGDKHAVSDLHAFLACGNKTDIRIVNSSGFNPAPVESVECVLCFQKFRVAVLNPVLVQTLRDVVQIDAAPATEIHRVSHTRNVVKRSHTAYQLDLGNHLRVQEKIFDGFDLFLGEPYRAVREFLFVHQLLALGVLSVLALWHSSHSPQSKLGNQHAASNQHEYEGDYIADHLAVLLRR